jgi:arginyl-tRNA synthetase
MLITELFDKFPNFVNEKPAIADLQVFYRNSKIRYDTEEDFKLRARNTVVKLQSGDEECKKGWEMLCNLSREEFDVIYKRLDIKIQEMGESFYNHLLAPIVDELMEAGHAKENEGAICIFLPKIKVPLIIRKSDGGFNYDTTDMAALRYRINEFKADRIIIVTDDGQKFHFQQIYKAGEMCGFYQPGQVRLDHMGFGLVLQKMEEQPKEEGKEEESKEVKPEPTAAAEAPKKEGEEGKEEEAKGGKKQKKQK